MYERRDWHSHLGYRVDRPYLALRAKGSLAALRVDVVDSYELSQVALSVANDRCFDLDNNKYEVGQEIWIWRCARGGRRLFGGVVCSSVCLLVLAPVGLFVCCFFLDHF